MPIQVNLVKEAGVLNRPIQNPQSKIQNRTMSDRGKYHGQRLKAKDVLRLYAAGERDFRGTILRGGNFRGADLSGADFTGADIRSARFIDANLQQTKFCHARGGLRRRWIGGRFCSIVVIAVLTGILQAVGGGLLAFYLQEAIRGDTDILVGAIASIFLGTVTFATIARQGFTIRALGSVAGAGAGTVAVAVAVVFSSTSSVAIISVFAISGAISGAVAVAIAIAVSGAVAAAVAAAVAVTFTAIFVLAISGAVSGAVAVAVSGASFFLSLYINRRIQLGDPKFENLRIIGLAFAALGGTTFSGADLTGATLAYASVNGTNFADSSQQPTVLTHVRWHGTERLDRARLGPSNLQDPRVRQLLVSLNGVDRDLSNADLRGVNLAGATLHRISLKGANLNGATLAGAELHGANLTNAQCVGTDFTGAHLTGACLEAWNIDETTILQDIDCEYVFLKEEPDAKGNRERRPHNPEKVFQPGDFEKFFKEMLDTVQILIRNGVDPRAFQAAFEQVMADHPDITRESIQAMEKQGDDVLLTLQVPEGTDKAQVERSWDAGYQLGLEAGYTKGLLQGQTQRAEDVKEVALGFSKFLSSIQITNMNNPINSGDGGFINTGSMEGNVVNLGELSGQVTVQINQLPDAAPSTDQRSLKDLLTELQAAIEAETELSDVEKKEALGEVSKLAEAGTQPQDNAMQRVAKRAAANLKSITEPLTEASNLVTVCQSLLPLILAIF